MKLLAATKIKKILSRYIEDVFSDSKWYRKLKGGVWYYISELDISGFASNSPSWVKKLPEGDSYSIERIEEFPNRTV